MRPSSGCPIAYLLRAVLPALLYMGGATGWAIGNAFEGDSGLAYWMFILLILRRSSSSRPGRRPSAAARSCWAGAVRFLGLGTGSSVVAMTTRTGRWHTPGWELPPTSRAGLCFSTRRRSLRNPYWSIGAAGIAVLGLVLTFDDVWRSIELASSTRPAACPPGRVGLPGRHRSLGAVAAVRGKWGPAYGSIPLWGGAGPALSEVSVDGEAAAALFNLYVLALGVITLAVGLKAGRLGVVNGGMLLLAAFIFVRFFDSDMPPSSVGSLS